ncbi:MAG: DUF721 domain-containing protein [Alphaproteobacteria bacterium]
MAPRALSRSLLKVTRPVLEKRGADFAALVSGWTEIAGPRLAGDTAVDRLARPRGGGPGVLHLVVEPALARELQHLAPQIVERVNAYLGHAAVARIALVQRPVARATRPRPAARQVQPDPESRRKAAAAVTGIADEGLRDALARLGSHVLRRR